MLNILSNVFLNSVSISFLVLLMMILVDVINVRSKGKLHAIVKDSHKWKQYIIGSFLGTVPGCLGSYSGVSLYMHGIISYGTIAGLMIATSGDESFVMLAMFPKIAILLFVILFIIGLLAGRIIDYVVLKFNIPYCNNCETMQFHKDERSYKHYFKEHVWHHIVKKHL